MKAYKVVVNHEEQYSLVELTDRDNPPGWRDAGISGEKEECLEYIRKVWTDMRPLSLRQTDTGARGKPKKKASSTRSKSGAKSKASKR